MFWCCSFHETEAKKKQKGKTETKRRNQKKAKKDKKEEKNRKEQERDGEREIEKGGGQKRLRRNKGRDSKINKNALF